MSSEMVKEYGKMLRKMDWITLQREVSFFQLVECYMGFRNDSIVEETVVFMYEELKHVCVDIIATFDDEESWVQKGANFHRVDIE